MSATQTLTPELREVIDAIHYRPAISVIMPFEPKMSLKNELTHSLKLAADKVQTELSEDYPEELAALVMDKFRNLVSTLNFYTHKRSIAIYVSPVFEKVLYLDMPVEEKIIVGESFEIRDLVYSKKEMHKYLVLVMSNKESRMYLGDTNAFVRLVSSTPESAYAYVNDAPERVANFSDPAKRKEILMDKFLKHIDNGLDIMLNAYQLPLFVMGAERVLGHFKKLTRHEGSVIEYIKGNYENSSLAQLREVLQPYISDWKKVRQKDIINRLDEAMGQKKLAIGMTEVWREAMRHNGRLLVLEKNFMYAAEHGNNPEVIRQAIKPYRRFSYIKDAVDEVIEKVLENGGDVEFVDTDLLNEYNRIALIQFH